MYFIQPGSAGYIQWHQRCLGAREKLFLNIFGDLTDGLDCCEVSTNFGGSILLSQCGDLVKAWRWRLRIGMWDGPREYIGGSKVVVRFLGKKGV